MAETFFPFDAGDGAVTREDGWRAMARHWLPSGPLSQEDNGLEVFGDSSGMQVKVRTGKAWIVGHYYASDAERTLAIATADATNPRVDVVVLRADFVANTVTTAVVTGTPAASPAVPALTQNTSLWEISLGRVAVAAAAVTIAAANVTNYREPVAPTGTYAPASSSTVPSAYPFGVTLSNVLAADGWPITGTLVTVKRNGSHVFQELVEQDSALGAVNRYFRQGYYLIVGTPDGWGSWQRVLAGGDIKNALVSTSETTTSTTYAALATPGPAVTVDVGPSGVLMVSITCVMSNNTAGVRNFVGLALSGANTVASTDARALSLVTSSAGVSESATRVAVFTGLAAGSTTVTAEYRVTSNTGTFIAREIVAIPL